jgi:hypothetical protein
MSMHWNGALGSAGKSREGRSSSLYFIFALTHMERRHEFFKSSQSTPTLYLLLVPWRGVTQRGAMQRRATKRGLSEWLCKAWLFSCTRPLTLCFPSVEGTEQHHVILAGRRLNCISHDLVSV